jgi:DNA-binding MarR family transcriptional regulator
MKDEAGRSEQVESAEGVVAALRAFGSLNTELGKMFARSQHMHATDAAAVVAILNAEDRGHPLTPARLTERMGLSSGATSTLLNRLEEAGHIVRTREQGDRRIVTLRSTPEIHEAAVSFFAPLGRQLQETAAAYSVADLNLVGDIVGRLHATMAGYLTSFDEARRST